MGVQDVVARLNKSKSATTTTTKDKAPPPPKRKVITTDNKIFPPSPASSPTTTIHNTSSTTSTSTSTSSNSSTTSNSIAFMLQKFNQPPTTNKPLPTPSTTTHLPTKSIKTISTSTSSTSNTKKVTPKSLDCEKFNHTANEIEDLFQSLIDQNKAAEEYIEKLQLEVEKYKSDSTKVRDYEIRVEYLALKLEQVSEERDFYEKEYTELQEKQITQLNNSNQQTQSNRSSNSNGSSHPMSPAYSMQQDIIIEDEQKLQQENNDAYVADILNVYEEISEQEEEEETHSRSFNTEEELFSTSQQQIECDKGMQMAIVKYITDLEQEKLETKRLKSLVKKQDELILKLEQTTTPKDELLKEQVELQKIELDNKRELLSQLLNEREELLKKINTSSSQGNFRKSFIIDNLVVIERKADRPNSYSSMSSSTSSLTGRGTPPLTKPPKQPLPPLPHA